MIRSRYPSSPSKSLMLASIASLTLAACGGGGGGETPQADALQACSALKGASVDMKDIALPTRGAVVNEAELIAANGSGATAVGEFCRVRGAIASVDSTAPPINFEVGLPTQWNARAIHLMGGGYDGQVVRSTENVPGAPRLQTPLGRGYVAFGSDSGHTSNPPMLEGSFALNDEALENFFGDQLRKTRDVAMKIVEKRYGKLPMRTYSAGGSGGGREALYVADRWPTLYDGVITYYPAWSLTAMLTQFSAISKALAAPGAWSNSSKQALVSTSVIKQCDALDGAVDGIVSRPDACTFLPQTLRCPSGSDEGNTCLSDAQITGFKAYDTPLNLRYQLANGTSSYPGFGIFKTGLVTTMGTKAPADPSSFTMPFATFIADSFVRYSIYRDASYPALQFDPNANGYVTQRMQYISSRWDVNPNLEAFAKKGGKVILVHGSSDAYIPNASSRDFYERAVAAMGRSTVQSAMRFFDVPGYGHGEGSFVVNYDGLAALEKWVEEGAPPSSPVASDASAGGNGRTRPMCEYPKWPKFNANGNVDEAANYSCVE